MPTRSVKRVRLLCIVLLVLLGTYAPPVRAQGDSPVAKYVILLISDGWGPNHIAATVDYVGRTPSYQGWTRHCWIN